MLDLPADDARSIAIVFDHPRKVFERWLQEPGVVVELHQDAFANRSQQPVRRTKNSG